ncbi:MAG: KH domain-containing protein [Synergistaceae bacterium]|nr:KH domain-containing protein [Synergistaceae bacterium]
MANYVELVEFIAKSLVTKPEAVVVEATKDEDTGFVRVLISADSEDTGRIIGKKGATINSIRHVAKAASIKSGERIDVDVKETL